MAKMVEAECNGANWGLESDPDVETWVGDVETGEETGHGRSRKHGAWEPPQWSTVMTDEKRTSGHWAGKRGDIGDVDKSIVTER